MLSVVIAVAQEPVAADSPVQQSKRKREQRAVLQVAAAHQEWLMEEHLAHQRGPTHYSESSGLGLVCSLLDGVYTFPG